LDEGNAEPVAQRHHGDAEGFDRTAFQRIAEIGCRKIGWASYRRTGCPTKAVGSSTLRLRKWPVAQEIHSSLEIADSGTKLASF
jgi:hypothetical protein